jgi:hypothetical protein
MRNERTQKDLDIARMSAMKGAIELVAAFPDKVKAEGNDGLISTTCKVADKLYEWILKPSTVQGKVDDIRSKLNQPNSGNGNGNAEKVQKLKESIARDPHLYLPLNDTERSRKVNRWLDRASLTFGGNPGDPYPLSSKQFGFIIKLLKDLGVDRDPEFVNCLSNRGASAMIDNLQEFLTDNGH